MKHIHFVLLSVSLLTACGRTETAQDNTQNTVAQPVPATTSARTAPDSGTAAGPKPQNCRSILDAATLGKVNTYRESAKPVTVGITLAQDTSTTAIAGECYFNNTVTVQATNRSNRPLFKRTLLKDDLLYFSKRDEAIQRAVLQNVIYKPTFNGERYITLTMRLMEPGNRKTTDYTVFMNYFGEIVKVN